MKTTTARLSLAHLRLLGLAAALVIAAPLQARAAQVIDGLKIQRAGHTATRLRDGNILIVGGENGRGAVRDSEIFDPISRTFSLGAGLLTARTEHTATRLPDGRVLVIGGRTSSELLHSTDIYDPGTRSFSSGPILDRARAGHTATLLPDGRIVVVGGDGDGSVEIFDPQIGAFSRIEARLAIPRRYHSAALLKDGSLLIAGGNASDGSILSSAELLDTRTLSFSPYSPSMRVPRSGLALRVLPDGKVQAIGGDTEGTMEMFNPEGRYFTAYAHFLGAPGSLSISLKTQSRAAIIGRSGPAKLLSILGDDAVSADSDLLDRTAYSLTELPGLDEALGAGGSRTSGTLHTSAALYTSSAATVMTDKTDYHPGEIVVITGTGWQPEETVSLNIHRDTNDPPDTLLYAVADASGNIQNSDYVVQEYDLGVSFLLTATGQSSGYTAQTTFTDAISVQVKGKDDAPHQSSGGEENLGSIAQGTPLSLVCPRGTGLTVKATGLGSSSSIGWALAYVTGYVDDATLSPLTTLTPSSGTLTSTQDSACAAVTITTGSLTVGTTYHGELLATPSGSGLSSNPTGPYFFKFTVISGCTAPTITTCAPAQSASAGASCQAAVPDFTGTTVVSSPGCTANVTQSPAAGTLVGLGPHTVTITATNASGTATCQTTFTVSDTTAPVPNVASLADVTGQCSATVTAPTATDNCDGTVTATTLDPLTYSNQGDFIVHWTYKDAAGNTATQNQSVKVHDTTAPVPSVSSLTDATGQCSVTVTAPTATDNCDGTITATTTDPLTYSTQGDFIVHWTYKDTAGNTATQNQNVKVHDTTAPVPNVSSLSDATGQCSATVTAPTATDNCDGTVTATTPDPLTYSTQGDFIVHWTYKDATGNTATQNQSVKVHDTTAPTITTCPPASSALAGTGCIASIPSVTGSVVASDNCTPTGSLVITQSPTAGTPMGLGVTTITVTVKDAVGNSSTCQTTFTVTNDAPVIGVVTGPPGPLAIGTPASVTANFTDTGSQGHTCTFSWDDGTQSSVTVGAGVTSCTGTRTYASPGVYTVSVTVTDDCSAASLAGIFEFVVVYDPNAGFVTGGGFIISPAGSDAADLTLTGKANFGFVSKYKKGSNVPDGETEFQFKAGDINFHSSAYDAGSLVISGGRKATYRGDGTVNGQSGYRFLLIAYDGNQPGGDGVDRFRIKVTQGGSVIYDNRMGVSEDLDLADPTALGGGSIVIHK